MQIKSPAFREDESIPQKYTCEGPNISPPLQFLDVPLEAKTLVLMVEDPDAPARPWVHWLVFNIPPKCRGFEEGSIDQGAQQGWCNGNTFGYEGPCPPGGEHAYLFRLYALKSVLQLPPQSDRKDVLAAMQGEVLTEAVLRGRYRKGNKS
ncbi:YbhB/YbcL family Raf kinase inhibitor-like protein [Compostibacter hankyongensis]|uniref:YbhB/YbcL family Raf kinase inhibitor-like protein n=1 Tax=Compostibacter hankyongensis TaxID=1007089 RepID=A0ABP8FCW6_9BACT